jgi:hypothetical protein
VHVLPVRRDHHQHHHRDDDGDLPGEGERGQAGHRQGQEDLVRRVGDRRQSVTGEHRQRDPLRKQRLTELGTAKFAADEQSLADVAESGGHTEDVRGPLSSV